MKHPNDKILLTLWTVCLAVFLFVCCAFCSTANAAEPQLPTPMDASLSGPSLASVPNSYRVYYEDFEAGPAGWVPKNPFAQVDTYWHQTIYNDGGIDKGVMWCGTDAVWYVTEPGYGNNWKQYMYKTFDLGPGPISLEYEIQYDTETDWDYVYVEVSNDNFATWNVLASHTGNSGGFVTYSHDISYYQNQTVEIRFIVNSDGNTSDEDGLWDSNGAARLDRVQITGFSADGFDTGNDGWIPSVYPPASEGEFRIEETPACDASAPCPGMTNAWVAYDPATGVFPFDPERDEINIFIESPVIEIPANATSVWLNLDMHLNLPLDNLVFYYFEIAGPPVEEGGTWENNGYVTYGERGYYNNSIDITPYITPGATRIRIQLGARDMYYTWAPAYGSGLNHTSSPMFDNISVWVTGPIEDPVPKPDLVVQNYVSSHDLAATTADLIRFDATVANSGQAPAWASTINWYVGPEARQFPIPEGGTWAHEFDAGDETYILKAAIFEDYLYVVGRTKGAFPGFSNTGSWDTFVQKYDLNENLIWTDQFGGTGDVGYFHNITADQTGIYVCGNVTSSLSGQPYLGGGDAYVRKYDLNGNELWTREFGTTATDAANGVSLRNGQVLVCGYTGGALPGQLPAYVNAGGNDAFLRAYGIDGVEGYTTQFGTAADEVAVGWVRDESANSYITGYIFAGWFEGETPYGDYDVFVRAGSGATPAWIDQFGTSGPDQPTAIAIDDSGVYVAGYCGGALPGQTYVQDYDAFVRKYDRAGNILWTDQFGTNGRDRVEDLKFFNECIVASGKVGISGLLYPLPGQPAFGRIDGFVRRYDADGTLRNTQQFGTEHNEVAYSLAVDNSGIYVAGARGYLFDQPGVPGDTTNAFIQKIENFFQPGETMSFTRFENIPVPGLYNNILRLDYYDAVNEVSESNMGTILIGVAELDKPDLEITSLTRVPMNPTDNDTITFNATVFNSTMIPVRSTTLNFKIADEVEGESTPFPSDVWTRQFGTTEIDTGGRVATHTSGVYTIGRTQGTFPGETNYGQTDYFLTKFDYDGNAVWTREFGGTGVETHGGGIAVDDTGVYTCGQVFGDLPGQTHGSGYSDAWVRKYDLDGNELWTDEFGSLVGWDAAEGLCLYENALYVCGRLHPGTGDIMTTNPFVRKYDLVGNVLWTQEYTVPALEYPHSITADASGIYLGGYVAFAFPGETYAGGADAYVRRCDLNGNEIWAVQYGGANFDNVTTINIHPSGVYVIGDTENSLPGNTLAGPSDTYVARLDRFGEIVWIRQFGSYNVDHGLDFAFEDLTLIAVGYAGSNLPGFAPLGGNDGFVRRYDLDGNELATEIIGTTSHDQLTGIAVGAEGVFIAGHTDGILPGQTSTGGTDAFLMKYQDYIQGGESVVISRFDHFPEIGNFTTSVTADALGIIDESDESNNTAEVAYVVGDWDSDDDGVPDPLDLCPFESALSFDSNGDGCIDEGAGGRHVEYWDRPDFPITYYMNEDGAPGVLDGSDFAAIHDAMFSWTLIPGTDASVIDGGTTPQKNANAMDGINLVTFEDTEFQFGLGVLAVGITTSFTEPTVFQNKWYRPGQICDSDMIFNRSKSFRTLTDGPPEGTLIESVATHEAGHVFGISHSAVQSATMYFVLSPDTAATTLETEDKITIFKAYATTADLAAASCLRGTIIDGYTGGPLAGAAVFAIDAADGDTVASEYTLPHDGSYSFMGLPNGDYYIGIHPLNGSSAVGYIQPAYINHIIAATANTLFVPEWWDAAESEYDDPEARTAVSVFAGGPEVIADFTTNIDDVGPEIISTVPEANATGVSIGGSILISFSEPVNSATLQGNFSLTNETTGEFVLGNAAFLSDDMLIAYVPSVGLDFSTPHKLTLGAGLQDNFGNGLELPFEMIFVTEDEPPVALTSLAPSKGTEGIIVSVNGKGFDPEPSNNTVTFNGASAVVSQASPTQLVVTVPYGATSGVVNVVNTIQGLTSNDLQFTILSTDEVPKGFESGVTILGETPRALTILPDGSYAFMATDLGAQAVVVDPSIGGYLAAVSLPVAGGLNDIDATPSGNRVYGVSWVSEMLYRIDTTPGAIGVLSETPIGARPRGILINPRGNHAFIPTDEGEIQIWDVDESSPSFLSQVGRVLTQDPNIRGEMATDPIGERLIALSGTGKLLVFDLVSKTLLTDVSVGPDPRDVAVDPLGRRAYVSDETGVISIVSLDTYVCVQTIRTGGTLRGIAVTPGGAFAHAVNRELNILNAIDLRESSPTFRSVAATIPLPVNPVDIELSPDGKYAFTVSEAEQRLVVTTIGLGPSLAAISKSAGPAGATLVFSGTDFAADSAIVVSFDGVIASPDRVTENVVVVPVPPGASSGPVSVIAVDTDGTSLGSNTTYFDVLDPTLDDALRLAATLPGTPSGTGDGGSVLCTSPTGGYLALADKTGGIHIMVTDPDKPGYHQYTGSMNLGAEVRDIAISMNGETAFVALAGTGLLRVVDVNVLSDKFLTVIGTIDFSGVVDADLSRLAMSPDGTTLLVSDPGTFQVHFVDVAADSPANYQIVSSVGLASGNINGIVHEMAFHPGGDFVYLPVHDADPAVVLVMDTNTGSPAYQTIVSTLTLPGAAPQEIPVSLSFTPNGERCLVLTSGGDLVTPNRSVVTLDASDPAAPFMTTTLSLGGAPPSSADRIDVSPRGDRAVASVLEEGYFNIAVGINPDALALIQQTGDLPDHLSTVENAYAPDASVFYSLSESSDNLLIYDFSTVQNIAILSGDGQSGVINEPLPMPLRIQVSGSGGSTADVPVTFTVTSGGGFFAATNSTTHVVTTDDEGIAEVNWTLGPDVGPGAHSVEAASSGLVGSPLTFTVNGLDDPLTLPLTVTAVTPEDGKPYVSIATAIQVTFSRPIDPSTIDETTLFLHEGNLVPVPAVFGFSDFNRRVSLSPRQVLEPTATYTIEITDGIVDEGGGALTQSVTSTFMTEPLPTIALGSIAPASGSRGATVVLSGASFNPDITLTKVLFNDIEATLREVGKDFVDAVVPLEAIAGYGNVRVINTEIPDTSNALGFTVLDPLAIRADDVVANVSTSSATRSVAISPDGAFAYGVSPYANVVVPINLVKLIAWPTIPVGENPVAITLNPEGTLGYVANHVDGTVTIFDIDPASPDRHDIVDAIGVGLAPTDLAISPDGDRLVVVNYGSNTLSILDTDLTSETYHAVVSNPKTSTGTRTVSITPDGGLLYLGTDTGYIVMSTTSYSVVSNVTTGSATRTVAITPDGAFLILLTTEGVVNIFDIHPDSPTQDQVIANVTTGSGTRTVGISPDGGLLYLIQEASDIIIVAELTVRNSVSVIEDGSDLPPTRLDVALVDTLTAGEDPSNIAFSPIDGSFIVTNSGDNTVTVFGTKTELAGRVVTDSPEPATPVPGVEIDAFELGTGELVATMITDDDGIYVCDLAFGDYNLTIVTPLGYTVASEETLITFEPGTQLDIEFELIKEIVIPDARKMSFWKHQLGLALSGKGNPEVDAAMLCDYLDLIEAHFNNNRVNAVEVYQPPASGECADKLQVAKDLLNLKATMTELAHAKQELLSLLFNVASGKLHLADQASRDGATVSMAVTLVDNMIDDGSTHNDKTARKIARDINHGQLLAAGVIPIETPDIMYADPPSRFDLSQNYPNPFNPATTIQFQVPEAVDVRLKVYDVGGRLVRTLVDEQKKPNVYKVVWDGHDNNGTRVASGVYFYKLEAGSFVKTRKMVILK